MRAAWSGSEFPILAYTDVDLSTDLGAVTAMVVAIRAGRADLAVGPVARRRPGQSGARREVISRMRGVARLHRQSRSPELCARRAGENVSRSSAR